MSHLVVRRCRRCGRRGVGDRRESVFGDRRESVGDRRVCVVGDRRELVFGRVVVLWNWCELRLIY